MMFNWSLRKRAGTDKRIYTFDLGTCERNAASCAYEFDLLNSKGVYVCICMYTHSVIYLILKECV